MERKLKYSEFAELIGVSPKTVYKLADRNEIITVNEKVNNRSTQLVVTDDDQIKHFKNIYRKNTVITGNYEDILTDNEVEYTGSANQNTVKSPHNVINADEYIDRIITLNDKYNERLAEVNNELITVKSKTLLLEDKANREGMYINEINGLKKDNNRYKLITKILIAIIGVLLILIIGYLAFVIGASKGAPVAPVMI